MYEIIEGHIILIKNQMVQSYKMWLIIWNNFNERRLTPIWLSLQKHSLSKVHTTTFTQNPYFLPETGNKELVKFESWF